MAITTHGAGRRPAGVRLAYVAVDGEDIYWLEGRPLKAAATSSSDAGLMADRGATPPAFNVRTRVHEYGGGAYVVSAGSCILELRDQRLYRLDDDGEPARSRRRRDPAGTATPMRDRSPTRPADLRARGPHRCDGASRSTTLVSIPLDGSASARGRARVGLRLLLDAAGQPGRLAAGVAVVAPSADAVGWHRAVGG